MNRYDHKSIEKKWQAKWEQERANQAKDRSSRPKQYVLIEFPYPSGDGLHVGHARSYSALDAVARKKRLEGANVLFPMGWDAFGLPTENYALKTGTHPREATDKNIATFRRQMKSLGLSFDWSREVDTTDPAYYRWTQWIFLQLLKKGLAYQATIPINWCPKDKIGLANEEVVAGNCERCGTPVTRKMQKQWLLKITAYADRLLQDLDTVDYLEKIKTQQVNWIGRSEGAEIAFPVAQTYRFVLVHGFKGSTNGIFFPWLAERLRQAGHEVTVVDLPHSDSPNEAEQVEAVLQQATFDERTILFGHSLGSVIALKVIEKLDRPIAGAVFAGGFIEPSFIDKPRPFAKTFRWTFAAEKIRSRLPFAIVLHDRNDDAVPAASGQALADLLQVPLQVVTGSAKHFCAKQEPILLEHLLPQVNVFTTRPDTIFGATYVVLAPEHPLVDRLTTDQQRQAVQAYKAKAANKSDLDRTDLAKEKTGVFTGAYAVNPANNEQIPIWIADYVLSTYGGGAVMAVPAHDERDFAFARKYQILIREVVAPLVGDITKDAIRRDVVKVVVLDGRKVLLVSEGKRGYSLPGGSYNDDESPQTCVRREVREETGFLVDSVGEYLGAIESYYFSRTDKVNKVRGVKAFQVEVLKKEPVKGDHEIIWLDAKEAIELLHKGDYALEATFVDRAMNGTGQCFIGEGVLINSSTAAGPRMSEIIPSNPLEAGASPGAFGHVAPDEPNRPVSFNGLSSVDARVKITSWLERSGHGKKTVQYKLRDWVFSRQHYWGEPIPIIHCPDHGAVPVPEKQLPVELPYIEKYQPTDTGESPLATMTEWVNTACPICEKPAKRETDTMPNWAGSSWYFLRYCDPKNAKSLADKKKLKHWLPVDIYNGGMEHTTLHLLYSRFWYKFLFDQGLVSTAEPYQHRHSHGVVLAEDGQKMSKSRGNVINPDELVEHYGADSLRLYEMFMGPFEDAIPWQTKGLIGMRRFLDRVWALGDKERSRQMSPEIERQVHRTIKKVTEDIQHFRFNTSISSLMILQNALAASTQVPQAAFRTFLILLNPFAPHISEELWERLGFKKTIADQSWPTYDESKLVEETITLIVQVNGKVRDRLAVPAGINQPEAVAIALRSDKIKILVTGQPKKVIFVPDKLLNFVV